MNKSEFVGLLNDLEWEDFEVKEAKQDSLKNSMESVTAFSNTAGGWIVFGVKKTPGNYEIIGILEPQEFKQEFSSLLKEVNFNQKINIKCIKYKLNRKILLAFYIPPSENKPVYFGSVENTFVRTFRGNRTAIQEEIDIMFTNTSLGKDEVEPKEFTIDNVDLEKVKNQELQFRNVALKYKQKNIFQEKSAEVKPIADYSNNPIQETNSIKENSVYSGEVEPVESSTNSEVLSETDRPEGNYSNGIRDNYSDESLEEENKDYSENLEKPVKDLRLEDFNHKDLLKGHIEGYTKEQITEYKKDPKEDYKQSYPKKSEDS
ncbi:MAG: ATP-binding protein [Candidatus Aenigmarchaeota archaeon]|nr:ATP-binding protein [Candidatus Aenigmarchaeota archaeon]